jgi:hypothetical protein
MQFTLIPFILCLTQAVLAQSPREYDKQLRQLDNVARNSAVLDQDKWIQKYREQDYAYLTDLYMQFFPGFTYSYNPPATDCPPVLRVQANSLDLLDKIGWV